MDTARGLDHGAFRVELDDHVLEVAGAFIGRAKVDIEIWFVGASFAVNG
jgi:hypothetical protein